MACAGALSPAEQHSFRPSCAPSSVTRISTRQRSQSHDSGNILGIAYTANAQFSHRFVGATFTGFTVSRRIGFDAVLTPVLCFRCYSTEFSVYNFTRSAYVPTSTPPALARTQLHGHINDKGIAFAYSKQCRISILKEALSARRRGPRGRVSVANCSDARK